MKLQFFNFSFLWCKELLPLSQINGMVGRAAELGFHRLPHDLLNDLLSLELSLPLLDLGAWALTDGAWSPWWNQCGVQVSMLDYKMLSLGTQARA